MHHIRHLFMFIVLVVLVFGFAACGETGANTDSTSTQATQIATPTPTSTQTSIATSVSATAIPTTKPTPLPTHASGFPATHGTPLIGGPFSDYVGKYGQPIGQGQPGSYNFQSDTPRPDGSLPLGPNVTPNTSGEVVGLTIIADSTDTISFTQAQRNCEKWLPDDAVVFNIAAPYVDYHSSVGEIVMMLNDPGDCVLSIAGS